MKKGKVFFHPIEGSAALTISWSSKPKGDAIEANKGTGVGFFSENGSLLCVVFDEIQSNKDHQILEFDAYRVELTAKTGHILFTVKQMNQPSPLLRKRRTAKKNNCLILKKNSTS